MTPLWHPSPNHAPRVVEVDRVVLHYTDMASAAGALAWLCNPQSRVSAHYLIAADGTVMQLVAEDRIAWHAGVSFWRGARDNNDRSIGIELDSPGHRDGAAPAFPEAQVAALMSLLGAIRARHTIASHNVVAHSDIAPHRKMDPGERFPWPRLAAEGHALPRPEPPEVRGEAGVERGTLAAHLSAIGYAPADRQAAEIFGVLPNQDATQSAPGGPTVPALLPAARDGDLWDPVCDAFHRRFRPAHVGRPADAATAHLAAAIAKTLPAHSPTPPGA